MIAYVTNRMRERALRDANEACAAISYAALMARTVDDHAAARYFEAELKLANAKRDALLGNPNPGRYCCDQRCERQGRTHCAREPADALRPQPETPWYSRVKKHHVWRAILLVTAALWVGVYFFFTT